MRFATTSLIAILLSLSAAYAATLEGETYDFSLEPLGDTIVSVNSTPAQVIVAKDHHYRFELPPGDYAIRAEFRKDSALVASDEHRLIIQGDGAYSLDLILLPAIPEEGSIVVPSPNEFSFGQKPVPVQLIILVIALFIFVIILCIALIRSRIGQRQREPAEDYPARALRYIRSQHGRCTQKELREALPLSEAKISLIVAELEHDGKIKKIKRGRGNILSIP